ncbi:MAG: cell wall metabolism sensor histidine kinase WalK [Caldilineales bacterium]|nr:cell wall metabolism sensor histidine kinase WalK [Caldilineales bacterium]MDW8316368.1 ATP-binding protein [Anaerolineae bacterium]
MVLTLVTMLWITGTVTDQVRSARLADMREQLLVQAQLIGDAVAERLAAAPVAGSLDPEAQRWAQAVGGRVTIVHRSGAVVGDSAQAGSQSREAQAWPEVRRALNQGETAEASDVEGSLRMAVPVRRDQEIIGVVRIVLPLGEALAEVRALQQMLLWAALGITGLVLAMGLLIANRTARPVLQLTAVANRLADGDLSVRLQPATRDEVGELTRAFNRMAAEMQAQMETLAKERGRLAAVLENMADGVVITGPDGHVRLINPSAARLLDVTPTGAIGQTFAQVVRHYQVIDLWQQCRRQQEIQVGELELDRRGIFWQVIVTPFHEAEEQGYLVIIQDLSRIRRLETVRRDFVSNISHELRTPLASLKALVETLRDGALDDRPAAEHFLDRMDTEVDALTQMVQELLELSRIESGQVGLRLAPTPVSAIVEPPVARLAAQAERKDLTVTVNLPDDLPLVWADAERIQQVVTNLVHNAIKFTPEGGRIEVRARAGVGHEIPANSQRAAVTVDGDAPVVIVSVADTGIGIPARDLSRIFERFYKADRARGSGGTGLGLAIARHLVQSHRGAIWVESVEGKGSTFYFALPAIANGERRKGT